ncbi:DUF6644 family protein [Pararhizobium gei]|uniref:DUF6644 family protein n=1 Tax=Pararhizobium gei TaxID=1395951 RepID=UPI0023DB7664|nr:DUF6644 family protein [Rhizobium gei]
MEGLLQWLAQTPVATALQGSTTLYIFFSAAHILSIGVLIGAVLPLDLRLAGLFRHVPVSVIGPFLGGAAAIGLICAIVTGACLFLVDPVAYAANPAFLAKLVLVAFGGLNALLQHRHSHWKAALADHPPAASVRLFAMLSMTIWSAAVVAGRWIGFL